ncbi:hypothetical protein ACLFLN_13920 [Acinetobacter pittii]
MKTKPILFALQILALPMSYMAANMQNKVNGKCALQGRPELGTGTWELYNIKLDRGERQNVAQLYPAKVQELLSVYQKYTEKNGVQEYNAK